MQLQHNQIKNLGELLFYGMRELRSLNLSHNALGPTIGAQDLRGLDRLKVLDLSHNEIATLENIPEVRFNVCPFESVLINMGKSFFKACLPSLEELNASHNRLVTLSERDFRGFPVLCWADVSANKIQSLVPELVANTRCKVHGVQDVLRIYLEGELLSKYVLLKSIG